MFEWDRVCGARTAVMGIVNVTPDSFSDGGRFLDPDAAVAHGFELAEQGADVLDVGGESTRPGATIVNDVSAGRSDPEILGVTAAAGAGYVVMHMQGEPRTMQADPRYEDVVAQVGDFLADRIEAARAAGVAEGALVADPGIGFGKTVEHNLRLLAGLPALAERVGVPVLVGTSR